MIQQKGAEGIQEALGMIDTPQGSKGVVAVESQAARDGMAKRLSMELARWAKGHARQCLRNRNFRRSFLEEL